MLLLARAYINVRSREAELKLKCKQARDNPLAKNGTNQHSDLADRALDAKDNPLAQHRGGDNVTPSSRGNDTDYTLRRLARDNPELLDAIESRLRSRLLSWHHQEVANRDDTRDLLEWAVLQRSVFGCLMRSVF
jgi:hypothetical protein